MRNACAIAQCNGIVSGRLRESLKSRELATPPQPKSKRPAHLEEDLAAPRSTENPQSLALVHLQSM